MGRKPGGRKTGGRQPGTPNKTTAEIRAVAQQYAPDALKELARLAMEAESESARIAAIKELLDLAYGKPPLTVSDDDDGPQKIEISWMSDLLAEVTDTSRDLVQ